MTCLRTGHTIYHYDKVEGLGGPSVDRDVPVPYGREFLPGRGRGLLYKVVQHNAYCFQGTYRLR
jgi:hypothetical protein